MRKWGHWVWVVSGTTLAITSAASTASAEPIDGKFRLSLLDRILELRSFTTSYGGVQGDEAVSVADLSLAQSSGVGVGYAVSEHVLLGGRLFFAFENRDADHHPEESKHYVETELQAIGEYVFDGRVVRPFLGPALGGVVTHSKQTDHTFEAFFIGAQAGLHAFPASSVSFDPGIELNYETGRSDFSGHAVAQHAVNFVVHIAISAWLGGKPSPLPDTTFDANGEPRP